ncbi:MAG TPA: Ig-like domain-containing protein, partial [Candidatus Limnocylindria bacterium]|nr:Ig-like domain-containing protein [Candidatus Limnocylindria bacterium]
NAAPTISTITNVTMRANTTYPAISFTVGDAETPAGSLTIDRLSSNPALLPLIGIVLDGSESNRTVTLTPTPDQTGLASITLTVIDDGGKSNSTFFTVNVIPTNTAPTISVILNQATTMNVSTPAISFTIGDGETAASNLTVTATSSNTTVLPQSEVVLGGSNASRTITLTPAAGQTGNALVSVTVSDGILTTNRTFVLSVLASAGTLLYEPFDYPDGPLVTNSLGLWQTHSGTAGQIDTASQVLFVTAENSEDVNARLYGEPYTPAGGATLYYSFRFSAFNLPTVLGDYFAHFKDNASNFRAKFFVSTTNAPLFSYRIGVANGASFPTNAGFAEVPVDLNLEQTNFIVVRYDVGAGVATLWLNPTNESDTHFTASDPLTSTNSVTQFAIRESNFQGDIYVDDIRVARTFGEALGILPPPSVSLKVFRTGSSVVISWPASASGYTLQSNTNLNTTNWENVVEVPVVVGSDNVITNAAGAGAEFFRLRN